MKAIDQIFFYDTDLANKGRDKNGLTYDQVVVVMKKETKIISALCKLG